MIITIRGMCDSELNQKDFYLEGFTWKAFGWAGCAFVHGKFHVVRG